MSTDQPAVYEQLRAHLLRFGGERWSADDVVHRDISLGLAAELLKVEPRSGAGARFRRGRPSQCHQNAFELAERYDSYRMITGLALSDDGIWRPHSWCVDGRGDIVETTVERVLYLGVPVELDPDHDPIDYW